MKTIEGTAIRVEYESKQEALARAVCSEGADVRRRVVDDLGLKAEGEIGIRLYSSSPAFREAIGAQKGEIIVGIAHSHGDFIEMDASGLLESPHQILAHEITHILLQQDLRRNVESLPLWMNEGLAQMEAGPLPVDAKEQLYEIASQGRLPSLDSLAEAFPEQEQGASLAYLQSQAAVEFLRDRYGIDSLRRLLGLLRDGKGFQDSFQEATGVAFPQFQSEWEELLRHRSPWELLFRGGAPFGIWAAAALLVIYGFLRLRRRWKRKIREWEREGQ